MKRLGFYWALLPEAKGFKKGWDVLFCPGDKLLYGTARDVFADEVLEWGSKLEPPDLAATEAPQPFDYDERHL